MKINKRAITSLGAAVAMAIGFATPALAISYSGDDVQFTDPANTYWNWNNFSEASMYSLYDDNWNDAATFDSTWIYLWGSDNSTSGSIACSDSADISDATDGSDDQIILCDPATVDNGDGEVTTQLEFRFFDDLKTMRTRIILTNETDTAIEGQVVEVGYDSYYDEETSVYASTTSGVDDYANNYDTVPETVITPDDFRWVTDDRMENETSPTVSIAVGSAGSEVVPADDSTRGFVSGGVGNGEDNNHTYFEVPTLQPGQSVEFVVMTQIWLFDFDGGGVAPMSDWQTAIGTADAAAWANTDITSNDFVFAGISDTTKVLNWTPAAALAETGADLSAPLGAAAVIMFAGVALVVLRRRSQR